MLEGNPKKAKSVFLINYISRIFPKLNFMRCPYSNWIYLVAEYDLTSYNDNDSSTLTAYIEVHNPSSRPSRGTTSDQHRLHPGILPVYCPTFSSTLSIVGLVCPVIDTLTHLWWRPSLARRDWLTLIPWQSCVRMLRNRSSRQHKGGI